MTTRKRLLSEQSEKNTSGVSDETAASTCSKNELEKWKLLNEIHRITNDEKLSFRNNGKELRQLKDDITMMIAEGFVYKTHCFGKYDPFKSAAERERYGSKDSKSNDSIHVTSSNNWSSNNSSSTTLPSICENKSANDVKMKTKEDSTGDKVSTEKKGLPLILSFSSPNVNFQDNLLHLGEKSMTKLPNETKENTHPLRKTRSEMARLNTEYESANTSPRGDVYEYDSDDENETKSEKKLNVSSLASSFHGLVMWRHRARQHALEAEKEMEEKREREKDRPKRYLPKSVPKTAPPEFKAMFPGNCKTYYAMKKFVHKEAERMINQADSPMYEKKRERIHKLMQRASIPQFIRRDRTTSAIFRDFKSYQSNKGLGTTSSHNA